VSAPHRDVAVNGGEGYFEAPGSKNLFKPGMRWLQGVRGLLLDSTFAAYRSPERVPKNNPIEVEAGPCGSWAKPPTTAG
jgi:hypothetical protein